MNRDLVYIIKRVIIGVLIGIILFSLKSCNVKALTIDEVQWDLADTQYIRAIHRSSGNYYNYNSTSWGNYATANYRDIFEYGFYLNNPVCDEDYCLVENKSYIMSFFINSTSNFHNNFKEFLNSLDTFHIRASYLNTSNQKTWITLQQSSFNFYNVSKITDTSYEISIVFTMPKLPSSSNSSHFLSLDVWLVALNENGLIYTGGNNLQTGINNFSIENATPSNVLSYISHIRQQNDNQLIIQAQDGTTQAIEDLNDTIKDGSIPNDTNSKINNITNAITANQNTNIVQIATFIPQTLQVILNGFNDSCTGGYSLGTLYGTELILPCINPVDYLGSFLWGVIDSILCLCYLIPLCKFLVNKYNDLTSLKNLRWE